MTTDTPKRTRSGVGSALSMLAMFAFGVFYGTVGEGDPLFPFADEIAEAEALTDEPGWWVETRAGADADRVSQLVGLGYLTANEARTDGSGVTIHDPTRALPGYSLVCSAHDDAAAVIDIDGRLVHEWAYDVLPHFDAETREKLTSNHGYPPWRRVHAFDDGDLLAIVEGAALLRIDRNSELVWLHEGRQHHDLFVDDDGMIYAIARDVRTIPAIDIVSPSLEDHVSVLDPHGHEVRRVSIIEAFLKSDYAATLERVPDKPDITHANTVQKLDGSAVHVNPAFAAGNVLVSMREIDAIAVIDMEREVVVWAMTGMWNGQHEPTLLEDGGLLILDNNAPNGFSRVLEFDPRTQQLVWDYSGGPENGFDTDVCGDVQRLANGNTLITESTGGRAFEVTRDREIVWEFVNPHRAGDDGELIGALFQVTRLPPTFGRGWLAVD